MPKHRSTERRIAWAVLSTFFGVASAGCDPGEVQDDDAASEVEEDAYRAGGDAFGYADGFANGGYINGWAYDPTCMRDDDGDGYGYAVISSRVVGYFDGVRSFTGASTFEPRGDVRDYLRSLGFIADQNAYHGFALPIPRQYGDGQPHSVRVVVEERTGNCDYSGIERDLGTVGFATWAVQAHADAFAPTQLRGWAFDRDAAATSLQVNISFTPYGCDVWGVFGGSSHTIVANLASDDVSQVFGVPGAHRFDVNPWALVPPDVQNELRQAGSFCLTATALDAAGTYPMSATLGQGEFSTAGL